MSRKAQNFCKKCFCAFYSLGVGFILKCSYCVKIVFLIVYLSSMKIAEVCLGITILKVKKSLHAIIV